LLVHVPGQDSLVLLTRPLLIMRDAQASNDP